MHAYVFAGVCIAVLAILFPFGSWLDDWLERPRDDDGKRDEGEEDQPGRMAEAA